MGEVCQECGRPKPEGNTGSACFAGWYDEENYIDQQSHLDCKTHAIKQLRAQVAQLEGALENYDTTDAENHAVEEVVKKLSRIIDEGRQVGRFGGASLQALTERILRYVTGDVW